MSKSRYRAYGLAAFVVISVSLFVIARRTRTESQLPAAKSIHKPTKIANFVSLPIVNVRIAEKRRNEDTAPGPSDNCNRQWEKLALHSLEEIHNSFLKGELAADFSDQCAATEKELGFTYSLAPQLLNGCLALAKNLKIKDIESLKAASDEDLRFCRIAIFSYRAQAIDQLTKSESDINSLGLATLSNKLIAISTRGKFGMAEQEEMISIANALIGKDPNLYAAHKAKAAALMFSAFESGDRQIFNDLERAVENCKTFDIRDDEMDELSIAMYAIREEQNPEKFGDIVKSELERNPESAVLHYYLASYYWKTKDKEKAVAALDEVLKKDPHNERFKKTRDKIALANTSSSENFFVTKLTVTFDDL